MWARSCEHLARSVKSPQTPGGLSFVEYAGESSSASRSICFLLGDRGRMVVYRYGARGLLLLLLLTMVGCDDSPTEPIRDGTDVYAFEVDFRVEDAEFVDSFALVQFDAPEITPSVNAEGAVLAYARIADTWTALPYTYGVESEDMPAVDYTVTLGFAYEERLLEVFYDLSFGDPEMVRDFALENLPDRRIKVVVIEDFVAARSTVDVTSYEAVRQHFGLEE